MEQKIKNIFKTGIEIKMPTKLMIGDEMYLSDEENKSLTYSKSFSGKSNWVGYLELMEDTITIDSERFTNSFNNIHFKAYFALNIDTLRPLKQGEPHLKQRRVVHGISVDSASYILSTMNACRGIDNGYDGCIGSVTEYYSGSSLKALVLDLDMGVQTYDISKAKSILEEVFECNFKIN